MAELLSAAAAAVGMLNLAIQTASSTRLLRITSDLQAEIDLVILEVDASLKTADIIEWWLEGRKTRTLSHNYESLTLTWGNNKQDQLRNLTAKTFLGLRKTTEVKKRPLVFVAQGVAGAIVRRMLGFSQSVKPRAIFELTLSVIFLSTPGKSLRLRREEISQHLSSSGRLRKRAILWRMSSPGRLIRRSWQVLLPAAQIVCIALMSSNEPTQPNLTTFVLTCCAYSIFAMLSYHLNSHHKYQRPVLTTGLLIGIVCSVYLHHRNTSFNVLTTIMPASMTFALILSALYHALVGKKAYTEEEKVFQLLDAWTEEFVAEDEENGWRKVISPAEPLLLPHGAFEQVVVPLVVEPERR